MELSSQKLYKSVSIHEMENAGDSWVNLDMDGQEVSNDAEEEDELPDMMEVEDTQVEPVDVQEFGANLSSLTDKN